MAYVERSYLTEQFENLLHDDNVMCPVMKVLDALEIIDTAPSADVQEIKHGYWIDKPTGRYCHIGSYCSVCEEKSGIGGIESNRHKPYCPNCGAKMDGTPKERGGEK